MSLTGLGLEFTGGYKSPILSNRKANIDKEKTILIDTARKIKEVSFYIYDGKQFNGIRLNDKHGNPIVFEQWNKSNYNCEWVT